jgi:hypothetical protein
MCRPTLAWYTEAYRHYDLKLSGDGIPPEAYSQAIKGQQLSSSGHLEKSCAFAKNSVHEVTRQLVELQSNRNLTPKSSIKSNHIELS